MEQSLYLAEVRKYFPGVAARVLEKINDSKNPLTYLFRRFFAKKYSTTMQWESLSSNRTIVAADVVAMDSPLPLKKRDAIARATGDIPKLGMEMYLNEKQLSELRILALQPSTRNQMLRKLFADTETCIAGVFEQLENMALQAVSSGVCVIETDSAGIGIRVDFGYLTANKFGTTAVVWSNGAATPLTDLQKLVDKATADGNTITKFLLDRTAFNNLVKSAEVRQLFAASINFAGGNIPVPSLTQVNQATQDRFGYQFEIIDRSVRFQKNGTTVSRKPWANGAVVGITSEDLGSLTWSRPVEMDHPVSGVEYATIDELILASKFRSNRPSLAEFTQSQAMVLPVLEGVDSIYLLDSTTVQA